MRMSDEYLGCGNHSCRIEKPKGMGTNAGCSCLDGLAFEQRSKILRAFDRERKHAEDAEAECGVATEGVENIQGKVAMYSGKYEMEKKAREKAEGKAKEQTAHIEKIEDITQWFAKLLSEQMPGYFLTPEEWYAKAEDAVKDVKRMDG